MKKVLLLVLATVLISAAIFASDLDTFVNLTIGEPNTLDPHYAYDTASGEVINNMYDNLIKYDGADLQKFLPMLATEVPTVENGLIADEGRKYIFPLRDGVMFHTGNIMTPADVEYSFERGILYDPAGGPMWMMMEAFSGGEFPSLESWFEAYSGMSYSDAVNDAKEPTSPEAREKLISFFNDIVDPMVEVEGNNIIFNLKGAFAPTMWIIVHYNYWSAIIDAEWCKANGAWDGNADGWWKWHDLQPEETPLHVGDAGSGPFKLVEWDRTQQKVILERFDEYWQEPAKLKTVVIWGVDEFSTRKSMFEAGDADIAYFGSLYRDQAIDLQDKGIASVTEGYPQASVTSLHFSWNLNPDSEYLGSGKLDGKGIPADFFSDKHVRKAFTYCYDGETFINEVIFGLGKMLPADLPEGFLGYDPTLPLPEFNLAKAAEEFKLAWGGEVWKNGFELKLLYNTGNEMRQTAMEMLAFFVNSINPKFKVEPLGVQWPTYLEASRNNMLPLFSIGWNADYPDPHNFIATYYASFGPYGGRQGTNFIEWAKANVDDDIKAAAISTDNAERIALYKKVQEKAIEDAAGIPLYQPLGFHVERTWVRGWYPHSIRSGFNYYELSKVAE